MPQLSPSRYQGGGSRANAQALGGQKPWTNKTGSTGLQHQKNGGTQNTKTSGNQKATGRVFALQEEEADPSIIEGNLVFYNSWVHVLFDIGASHSFISSACAQSLGLVCEPLETALNVMSPMGGRIRIGLICKDCKIGMSNLHLTCDLRVMKMSDFDIILGMDWLSAHRAVINCHQRKVVAHTLDGTRFQFKGDRQDPIASTKHRTQWCNQIAGRIASLILNEEGQGELELPRIVCEYADVFPTELTGLPPTQEVDLSIELQPGTTPISMAPYPNVVADALSRKSRGMMARISIKEWDMVKTLNEFRIQIESQDANAYLSAQKVMPKLMNEIMEAQKHD
ncbi:uncharacterized protein LOC114283418 [Camellia sinensis]|uniref:uncharacterized protein LOC114283418 n=1 Tax=Camellia sinensis TaxID=4442 RepID=UPI001035F790|nr:uncharacterized protein LOC114283418 [Camellia sinensis]